MKQRTLEELALLEDIKELKDKYMNILNYYTSDNWCSSSNHDIVDVEKTINIGRVRVLCEVLQDLYKILGIELWRLNNYSQTTSRWHQSS